MNFIDGEILCIDKPLKWTSFDVVNKIRLMFKNYMGIKKIKVGHAGTLDPLATGIVVVCTGKATKKIEQLMNHDKEYVATFRFGQTTPSSDLETLPEGNYPTQHLTKEFLEDVVKKNFIGEVEQVPPVFSAIRIDGKRADELARKGQTDVELKSRVVNISSFTIESLVHVPTEEQQIDVVARIRCSKGTYIRSIARDLGALSGSGAHLAALRRTAVGNYTEANSLSMEQVEQLIREQQPITQERQSI